MQVARGCRVEQCGGEEERGAGGREGAMKRRRGKTEGGKVEGEEEGRRPKTLGKAFLF